MLRSTANSLSVSWGVRTAVGSSRIRISHPAVQKFYDSHGLLLGYGHGVYLLVRVQLKPVLAVSSLILADTAFMSRTSF